MRILLAAYRDVFSGKSYRNFIPKPFLRFKSLAIQVLNPKIWMAVGSAVANPDAWVPICVCFGMPWFQSRQPATSFETPDFLGWCGQKIWRPVPAHNERASARGETPKSTVLTCKLIMGCAWLFPAMDSSYAHWSGVDVTYRVHWCSWALYFQTAIEYGMAISCYFLISRWTKS